MGRVIPVWPSHVGPTHGLVRGEKPLVGLVGSTGGKVVSGSERIGDVSGTTGDVVVGDGRGSCVGLYAGGRRLPPRYRCGYAILSTLDGRKAIAKKVTRKPDTLIFAGA